MTTLLNTIRQIQHRGDCPLLQEIVTDFANEATAHPCRWFKEWADKEPDSVWYTYWIDDCMIGFIYREQADFTTMTQFVQSYDDAMDEFRRQFNDEVDGYLDGVELSQFKLEAVHTQASWAQYIKDETARRMQPFYDATKG